VHFSDVPIVPRLCVRVVSSSRGGVGKTLFVRRLTDQLSNLVNNDMVLVRCSSTSLHVTVPLHGNSTDSSALVDSLLPHAVEGNVPLSRVFHLDVSPSVRLKIGIQVSVVCIEFVLMMNRYVKPKIYTLCPKLSR